MPAEKRRQVAVARKKLGWKRRIFLQYLAENHWHTGNAYKAMIAERGDKFVKRNTVSKWAARVDFYELVQMLRSFDIKRREATDNDRILNDHRVIADYGMDIVEVTNEKTGKVTQKLRNPAVALQALDKLGKNKKLWGTEEQVTRVVVDLVDLTGPAKHIEKDVTPVIEGELVDGDTE